RARRTPRQPPPAVPSASAAASRAWSGSARSSRQHHLGVVARRLRDRASEHALPGRPHRLELPALDELSKDHLHLEVSEGSPDATPHAAAERDPGIGSGRLVEEPLRLESLGIRIYV